MAWPSVLLSGPFTTASPCAGNAGARPFQLSAPSFCRIGDSDQIVKYIEEKYPEPKLGTPESTSDACVPILVAARRRVHAIAEQRAPDVLVVETQSSFAHLELCERITTSGRPLCCSADQRFILACVARLPDDVHLLAGARTSCRRWWST